MDDWIEVKDLRRYPKEVFVQAMWVDRYSDCLRAGMKMKPDGGSITPRHSGKSGYFPVFPVLNRASFPALTLEMARISDASSSFADN
ncbi:hypothetical protein CDAR_247181 [Caerostris darwini]|uniref:Uncharacterized protein n=1 Tax=Caerostris darwini TaxID=1538125 RepID=A0AAV4TRR2_9ARAC|nr:hypothetical protein CDAR_247181 [Caerostris darwini]